MIYIEKPDYLLRALPTPRPRHNQVSYAKHLTLHMSNCKTKSVRSLFQPPNFILELLPHLGPVSGGFFKTPFVANITTNKTAETSPGQC